jgi:hypothetical protein
VAVLPLRRALVGTASVEPRRDARRAATEALSRFRRYRRTADGEGAPLALSAGPTIARSALPSVPPSGKSAAPYAWRGFREKRSCERLG